MAYTTINKSGDYFGTLLYTGNNTNDRDITGLNFTPDFTWIKGRSAASDHGLFDIVRGADKSIRSNATRAEDTSPSNKDLDSFISGGIRVDQSNYIDTNTNSMATVAWNWKANGSGSANTAGSINSTVSVNTTAGFSIVSYTGTGANATVGHGLGSAPSMIFVKGRNTGSTNWLTGGSNISSNWSSSLHLNTTGAIDTYNYWQNQAPSTSTFALATDGANNQSGINFIAYCFAEKTGYSKFGSYTGNGNADGPFIYTGFKPAFVIIKMSGGTKNWQMYDNKRFSSNPINAYSTLNPNTNTAESYGTVYPIDFLSNGFKFRTDTSEVNNTNTFIYMAFGQSLVGSNNVPATAR